MQNENASTNLTVRDTETRTLMEAHALLIRSFDTACDDGWSLAQPSLLRSIPSITTDSIKEDWEPLPLARRIQWYVLTEDCLMIPSRVTYEV